MQVQTRQRIYSIDILRGAVMIIMALDHTRDMFHAPAFTEDPLNLATTTPFLFFTRWVTHFCAPVFVFLAGISAYLMSRRKSKNELSAFLFKRGLWLVGIEVVVITFGWTFNIDYNFFILQVIWAIGWSMMILALAVRLRFQVILTLGLLIVFGHNLLDYSAIMKSEHSGWIFDMLFRGNFRIYPIFSDHNLFVIYPILPWAGLMMTGFCFGTVFNQSIDTAKRKRILNYTGIGLLLLFVVLRSINIYGDPADWSAQKNGVFSFLSFINVTKYPPSLLFFCVTLGPAMLLLAALEKINNRFTEMITTFGRVPFFYYVLHFYFLHTGAMILYFTRGHSFAEGVQGVPDFPFRFMAPGEGYGLGVVYLVWIIVVVLLYPLCKWFNKYKNTHSQWWLSYL